MGCPDHGTKLGQDALDPREQPDHLILLFEQAAMTLVRRCPC
ncbi:hypothetical protein DFAR_2810030 [Desulfarculales bacterium]